MTEFKLEKKTTPRENVYFLAINASRQYESPSNFHCASNSKFTTQQYIKSTTATMLSLAMRGALRRCSPPVRRATREAAAQLSTAAPVIKRIGVLGLGLMGHGIVQVSAVAGFDVVAVDSTDAAVANGMSMIRKSLETIRAKAVAKGGDAAAAQRAHDEPLARITSSTHRAALRDCDLVIEAVPETMAIKAPVYEDLGRLLRPDAIIATNTSGLQVSDMAALCGRPQSTIGMHYFNPVQLMALVEIVRLPGTPQGVLDAAFDVARRQGKTAVICEDTPGFVVNALLVPYLASAMTLLDKGVAKAADIDVRARWEGSQGRTLLLLDAASPSPRAQVAMKLGAGHPMGPLHLADYVGLDTCHHILKNCACAVASSPLPLPPYSSPLRLQGGRSSPGSRRSRSRRRSRRRSARATSGARPVRASTSGRATLSSRRGARWGLRADAIPRIGFTHNATPWLIAPNLASTQGRSGSVHTYFADC